MLDIDELKIYRGEDYVINDKIKIHIPTLGEICDYGDNEYFGLVYLFTSTPSDLKWQLDSVGVDFTKINNFQLFSQIKCNKGNPNTESFIKKEDFQFYIEKTKIIFGDLNFYDFNLARKPDNEEELCLYNEKTDTMIDEYTYMLIADCLRKIHFLTENLEKPANEGTRLALIEDARDLALMNQNKEKHSYLLNMVSAMINCEGFKYNHTEVWNMKINAFMDSVKRISKIKNASLLLQSGYSGFGVSLKDIDNKQLDWLGDLNS